MDAAILTTGTGSKGAGNATIGSGHGRMGARGRRLMRLGTAVLALTILLGSAVGRAGAASPALYDLVSMAANDVNATWTDLLGSSGHWVVAPDFVLVDDSARTACDRFDAADTYGVCPRERTIYLGAIALGVIGGAYGEFAVAVSIAEAYGHHLLDQWGVDSTGLDRAVQAACLAGFWAVEAELGDRVDADTVRAIPFFYRDFYADGDLLAQGFVEGTRVYYAESCADLAVTGGSGGALL